MLKLLLLTFLYVIDGKINVDKQTQTALIYVYLLQTDKNKNIQYRTVQNL